LAVTFSKVRVPEKTHDQKLYRHQLSFMLYGKQKPSEKCRVYPGKGGLTVE